MRCFRQNACIRIYNSIQLGSSVRFAWDENKNVLNFEKHDIWFEEAQTIWADSKSPEFYDSDHSDIEDRFIRVGLSKKLNVLLVVFCERDENVRIISARKATKKERELYEEGI